MPFAHLRLSHLFRCPLFPLFPSPPLLRLQQLVSVHTEIYRIKTVYFPLSVCLPLLHVFFLPLSPSLFLALARRQKAWPLFIRGHCNNKLM